MLAFAFRRLVQSVFVMLAVALVAFVLFQYAGDPVAQMSGPDATVEQRAQLRAELGLDDPALAQFGRFIGNALAGRFGVSYQHTRPVVDIIAERLPATLELALVAGLIALVGGVAGGVYTAIHPRRLSSRFLLAASLAGISLPSFFVGILLIFLFSVQLGWLPSFGRGEVVRVGWWTTGFFTASGWKSLVLPALTLGLFQLTLIMRLVRSEMLEVLRTDYIRFCRARGLPDHAIHYRHALRNTLVPVITVTGLQLGSIVAFAIITETVFQWPGLGLLFRQAIQAVDIPVMSTYLLLVGLFFVLVNFVVDLLYHAVDPRLGRPGAALHVG